MPQMYHFLWHACCVNMAEHASESLKLFETALNDVPASTQQAEAGTVRLVRTACKAFEKRPRQDEKSTYPLQFTTNPKKQGIETNLFIHFRGNRFNVVFANGGRLYHPEQNMRHPEQATQSSPGRCIQQSLT